MGKPSKATLAIKELEKELEAEHARHNSEAGRIECSLALLRRLFVDKGKTQTSKKNAQILTTEPQDK